MVIIKNIADAKLVRNGIVVAGYHRWRAHVLAVQID